MLSSTLSSTTWPESSMSFIDFPATDEIQEPSPCGLEDKSSSDHTGCAIDIPAAEKNTTKTPQDSRVPASRKDKDYDQSTVFSEQMKVATTSHEQVNTFLTTEAEAVAVPRKKLKNRPKTRDQNVEKVWRSWCIGGSFQPCPRREQARAKTRKADSIPPQGAMKQKFLVANARQTALRPDLFVTKREADHTTIPSSSHQLQEPNRVPTPVEEPKQQLQTSSFTRDNYSPANTKVDEQAAFVPNTTSPPLDAPEASSPTIDRQRMEDAAKYPGILVHCYMGINRSTAILSALLIRLLRSNAMTIVEKIARRRPVGILSNLAFLRAVQDFSEAEQQAAQEKPHRPYLPTEYFDERERKFVHRRDTYVEISPVRMSNSDVSPSPGRIINTPVSERASEKGSSSCRVKRNKSRASSFHYEFP
ncbi:unnamed protein product [Amoebophrya sp. A25]|nr:unnamed protein product [Amoebophrya sp. A25]|eukprot:GSA25T00002196001.1